MPSDSDLGNGKDCPLSFDRLSCSRTGGLVATRLQKVRFYLQLSGMETQYFGKILALHYA